MSETTTNLLTGFQAASSKGGELLGDSGSLFGEASEDSAVSFSSVLNQAQSDQADGSDFAEQTTRLARETGSDASMHDRNKLPLEEGRELRPEPQSVDGQGRAQPTYRSVDSRDSLGVEPVRETQDPLEESIEATDTIKSTVANRGLTENSDVETTDPHLVLQDDGRKTPEQLATQVSGSQVQVSTVPPQTVRPDVASDASDDIELNLAARQSTPLSENLSAPQTQTQPITTTVDAALTTPAASNILTDPTTAAATAESGQSNVVSVITVGAATPGAAAPATEALGSTAPGAAAPGTGAPSLTVVTDAEQPIVSACLLYTSPSPRDKRQSRMPSSA